MAVPIAFAFVAAMHKQLANAISADYLVGDVKDPLQGGPTFSPNTAGR